ncbi:unnamed protein product [Ectocarpus sp. CCAP 1310/34]|nr:unnamed protein product [Ectocarpus sp. CCAP 1310/34]
MEEFLAAAKGGVTSISGDQWVAILRRFSTAHEGTWAVSPLCGLDNKRILVRVVVELLHHTVGLNGRHRSRTLGPGVEAEALLAARILLRERGGAERLMDQEALETYTKAAQEDGDAACGFRVSLMALKCLNNAVWDQPKGQISFVQLGGLDMLVGLLQVLAGCVRCTYPPFPGGEDRLKLMVQALQGLFLLGVRFTPEEKKKTLEGETMKRLGYVLVDILHLDHAELNVFMAKLQVLNLLLDMPGGFAEVLLEHGCLPRVVQLVELQLVRQEFQDGGVDAAAELTPGLLVLNRMVLASEESKMAVKRAIFPPEADKVWKQRLEREKRKLASLTGDDYKSAEKLSKDKRVHPVDAPKGTLRARLLKQMTATESSSKTAVSDLLFNLCADEEEFITRCGFGNAVNTLRLRGMISVPGIG